MFNFRVSTRSSLDACTSH